MVEAGASLFVFCGRVNQLIKIPGLKKEKVQHRLFTLQRVFYFEIRREIRLSCTVFWGEVFCFCQISRLGLGNCDSNITERLKSRAVDQQREES